ncbi:MAG TPA: phage integrase SAM-like domain-containing protein, partial [Solirubrobacterales bacterium]
MSNSEGSSALKERPACGDPRRLRKTKTPGVFKRIDGRGATIGYVAVITVAGRQRKRSARTYDEARRLKRESETDRDRGELPPRATIPFLRYLDEWVERYRGQGRRGFRDSTREEYRRLIRAYAHRYFSGRLKLAEVTTYGLARFLDWLADENEQGKMLSDRTIANAVNPLRAALATAKREGLIRHNPAQGLPLPHRGAAAAAIEDAKVFSPDQLAALLTMAPERHRLLFELLAGTGLRISEAIGLQRLHFQLDDGPPEVCIRRAFVKGRIVPPKSRHGKRDVRLSASLAARAEAHLAMRPNQDPTALVFTNEAGGPIDS